MKMSLEGIACYNVGWNLVAQNVAKFVSGASDITKGGVFLDMKRYCQLVMKASVQTQAVVLLLGEPIHNFLSQSFTGHNFWSWYQARNPC